MSRNSRVIWSEGLFIKPHHFQQMQRNLEYLLESRARSLMTHGYGVLELRINEDHLKFGKITLEQVSGVMPDGTFFDFPTEDLLPESLEITSTQAGNEVIYLAIAEQNDSYTEVGENAQDRSRYYKQVRLIKDLHSTMTSTSDINIAPVKLRLMLGSEDRSAYSSIAIGKIQHKDPSGPVTLYRDYIPCHLNSMKHQVLRGYLVELEGLVRTRAQNIAHRVAEPSQNGVADVSDFMMLRVFNTMHGELQHLTHIAHLHPESLFQFMTRYCAELSTFTAKDRLSPKFPIYDHQKPDTSLKQAMALLRTTLSIELDLRAIPIKITERNYGLNIAPLDDKSLFESAEFILAVRAQMASDELRRYFLQQAKVASIERIRDITSLQLPAVPLISLPVSPRQLPYHADFIYFKLDKGHPSWAMLKNSSGFALHVPSENFPELKMQLWAIRH